MNKVLAGLLIFHSRDEKFSTDAQHDQIFAMLSSKKEFSEEEKQKLEDIGWFWDTDADSWACFT